MRSSIARDLLILFALTVAVRAPFLDEAVQGDDVYYLLIAENARVDPWHPVQMGFRLQGETVWAAGHTRPPGNAYLLAALLAAFDGVREEAFHAVYAMFSLLALVGAYFLARRFTERPLVATLCVAATPAFLVNGNKLESDLPMLAFLTLGAALLVHRRFAGAAIALAVAAFFGYQTAFLLPVFAVWVWREARRSPLAWAALAVGPALLAGWQLFERAASGAAPAETLAAYFGSYGLLAVERKLRSTQSLLGHLGMMVSPLILIPAFARTAKFELAAAAAAAAAQALLLEGYSPSERTLFFLAAWTGLALLFHAARNVTRLPALWTLFFFVAAIAVFYAGSARYLLPIAPALGVIVANMRVSRALLTIGLAANFTLGLGLAAAERRDANAYREIAKQAAVLAKGRRVWSNAEWGLRYYLGAFAGGDSLLMQQNIPSGSMIVESSLAATIPYRVEGSRRDLLSTEIETAALPFRTIGPGSHTGYSSSEFGVLPFGILPGSVDRVTIREVGRPQPTLSYLKMDDPAADEHLLGGFYPSDGAEWRWMGPEAAALLKASDQPSEFVMRFHIPENAPARHVEIEINGDRAVSQDYQATGGYELRTPVHVAPGAPVRVVLRASPSFTPPGDGRDLAIVVIGFGFEPKIR
jgi:hypothetical protein